MGHASILPGPLMAQCPDELMWSDGQGASCSEELVEWVLLLTEMKTVTVVSSSPLYDEWLQLCALKLPEVDFWYENQDFRVLFLSLSLKKISAICLKWAFLMAQWVKNPPASAGDTGSIPGLGRSFREGNGNPLQYSCLTNPMDRGACPFGRLQSIGLQIVRQTKHKHTLTQNLYWELARHKMPG